MPQSLSPKRLYFIDAVRAFAILMMLQGHFIDTLLAEEYCDIKYTAYSTWLYFRGITAPIFFTISGLIVTYLLFQSKAKNNQNYRIQKGLLRGLMLIGIGYVLRIPIFEWFTGVFSNSQVFIIDVLQIIGLSLICIIILYCACLKNSQLLSGVCVLLGTIIFVTEPLYRTLRLDNVPLLFSNYVSKANGSIFTFLPWFGYVLFGTSMASIFYRYIDRHHFKPVVITLLFCIGYLLKDWSSYGLYCIYNITKTQLFLDAASYNYLFSKLGNVLICFAVFYGLERYLKHPLLLKIGQKTLSIYVIHFIIIYGSFTGFGLDSLLGKTLLPWQAILGALLFLIIVCTVALLYVKSNAYVYDKLTQVFNRFKIFKR